MEGHGVGPSAGPPELSAQPPWTLKQRLGQCFGLVILFALLPAFPIYTVLEVSRLLWSSPGTVLEKGFKQLVPIVVVIPWLIILLREAYKSSLARMLLSKTVTLDEVATLVEAHPAEASPEVHFVYSYSTVRMVLEHCCEWFCNTLGPRPPPLWHSGTQHLTREYEVSHPGEVARLHGLLHSDPLVEVSWEEGTAKRTRD